jgi:hypothetical protein
VCPDLPKFTHPDGKPYHDKLVVQITATVTAELFHSDHSNVVLPPSRHPLDGFVYVWTVFGEIRVVTWQWLQDKYGFRAPEFPSKTRGRQKKESAWHLQFRGDLASLDLIKLLEELEHPPVLASADEGKYSILCPWDKEHSEHETSPNGTGTVIWQPSNDQQWPGFDCKHLHCTQRRLKELLEWAEAQIVGIVDRHCARQRVWDESAHKHLSKNQLPRVLHAEGRVESAVYTEVGKIIAPHHAWFNRGGRVVRIENVAVGFEYSPDPKKRYKVASYNFIFAELSALTAKGGLEQYMEPGVLREDENKEKVFIPKSFGTDFCAGMVQSEQLKAQLDCITRILPVPLPFRPIFDSLKN